MATVMPLSEVPINHIRRNGQLRQPHASSQNGKNRPGAPNDGERESILQKPSSFESMLRNTTETGDVGQFSIKPSRVPSSVPRPSVPVPQRLQGSPSERSPPSSYYSGYGEYNGRSGRHTPSRSRNGGPSSLGSGTPKHSQEYLRGPYRAPSIEAYRSNSMTQNSYENHSLTHRHPYGTGHHQGRGGWNNLRPRSPFAYHTRLKRPGYRPSSPALNDLNRQIGPNIPGPYRDLITRTISPSSAYHISRAQSPWQQGFIRSDPMLRHYPPAQQMMAARPTTPSLSSSRPTTPKPSSSLRSVASSSRLRPVGNGVLGPDQSPQSSPMFYDYTEAFEEQDFYHSVNMSSGNLTEPTPPDLWNGYYSPQDESLESEGPAELLAKESPERVTGQDQHTPLTQSISNFNRDTGGWTPAPRQDLSDVMELPEGEKQFDNSSHDLPHDQLYGQEGQRVSLEHIQQLSSAMAETQQKLRSSHEESPRQLPAELGNNVRASDPFRRSRLGSPTSTAPVPSTETSSQLELYEPTPPEPIESSNTVIVPRLRIEVPNPGSDTGVKTPEVGSAKPSDSLRAPSFEGHSGGEFTEILSPTPERSVASPSSRSRFSKILSIDEGLSELDTVVNPQKVDHINNSPKYLKRSSSNAEHLWRKQSTFFRDKPTKLPVANKPLFEASYSDDEPELTSGLRATFCKPDAQIARQRDTPTPTPLPSKIPRRGLGTPLSLQRSPAPKKSMPDLLKPADESIFKPQESEVALADSTHTVLASGMMPPPPFDKELPAIQIEQPAVMSYTPPVQPHRLDLPFSFSPLAPAKVGDDLVAEVDPITSSRLKQEETYHDVQEILPLVVTTKPPVDRKSAASPPGSRPWNLDTSYPWDTQVPELEVTMPNDPQQSVPKLPRFKLRVHRASSSTGKLTKQRHSSETPSSPYASSHDLFQGPAFRNKRDPNQSIFPTQINSSHAGMRASPQQTRFVESFEQHSPVITLLPPSPGYEARSFFSDDSSQIRPKGSLRKRFSDFRAKIPRAASSDEARAYDRGLLTSALGRSRASSRQSGNTAGASSHASGVRRARWRMMDKLKLWWQQGEDKFRDWGWRMRYRRERVRAASTPLYAGV